MTNAEIIELLKSDDESAIQLTLRHVVPKVWPLFARFLPEKEIEEVVAMALAQLWHNRVKFLDNMLNGDLEGHFYVLARNVALRRSHEVRAMA